MKTCIINVGVGGWYPSGSQRLLSLLRTYAPGVPVQCWQSQYPPNGCPSHQENPYAFKVYSFEYAFQDFDRVLWLDCSMVPIQSLDSIWKRLDELGYLLLDNAGWTTGQWCTDAAMQYFGKTRDELLAMPHLMALCMGFDRDNPLTQEFFKRWKQACVDGMFKGPWTNDGTISSDPRVLGHRHDQTCGSIIATDLGMTKWSSMDEKIVVYPPGPTLPTTVFLAKHGF